MHRNRKPLDGNSHNDTAGIPTDETAGIPTGLRENESEISTLTKLKLQLVTQLVFQVPTGLIDVNQRTK